MKKKSMMLSNLNQTGGIRPPFYSGKKEKAGEIPERLKDNTSLSFIHSPVLYVEHGNKQ
jgi:hypothetical protein